MREIEAYYGESEEAGRLRSGSGLLEFQRTQELILRRLPAGPVSVLDIGGGPGAYAEWLTSLGHSVYLLDPVEKHVAQASALGLQGVRQGDARALPCEDGAVDVTLLLGPLYHLTERADRLLALREAQRVLKPGGLVFAAAISRYASLFHSLVDGFLDDDAFWPILTRDLEEGQHRNETGIAKYFTTSVFHRPEELRGEVEEGGFSEVEVVGIEGPGWLAKDFDERWRDERRRERLLKVVRAVECEAPLLGCSLHLMAVGRKSS
ncbi:MAG: methyltransferase domain-containing protein [Bryobacterales bacterium]|nr:methyltransferase domain-containing protein [Bryobacterales bacterium]